MNPRNKSPSLLTTWSRGKWKNLCLHYYNNYGHQTWQSCNLGRKNFIHHVKYFLKLYICTSTITMTSKLSRVVDHATNPYMNFSLRVQVANQLPYICTYTIHTIPQNWQDSNVLETLPINSCNSFTTWSSAFPQRLWLPDLVGWWLRVKNFPPPSHVTMWPCEKLKPFNLYFRKIFTTNLAGSSSRMGDLISPL